MFNLKATGFELKYPKRSGGTTPTVHVSCFVIADTLKGSSSYLTTMYNFSGDKSVAGSGRNAPC
jgi:hypothetical protein